MAGYGDLAFGPPHETTVFRKFTKKLRDQSNANVRERVGIGEFAHGIGRDQRDWQDRNIRPIEGRLSESIIARLGDQSELIADAQNNTLGAYDRSRGEADRGVGRYGVAIDDPSADREFNLERTKSAIEAGDLAAQADREQALVDASRFYGYGAGLPGTAAQEYIAGAGSLADQHDYATGQKLGTGLGQIDAQLGIAQAFADGGVVDRDLIVAGGRPGKTIHLRKRYNEYRVEASTGTQAPKEWPAWLEDQGYTLGADGHVVQKKYADGGVIDGHAGRVDLETNDFIVPRHAVDFYGIEFWDELVAGGDASGSRETGEIRYAGGGGVGVGFGAGVERGYGGGIGPVIGAVQKGLTYGLGQARRQQEHDERMGAFREDREYLRGERAHQGKQRQQAEIKAAYDKDLNEATARFVQSDGTDLTAILGVQQKYSRQPGGSMTVTPNRDGNTFTVAILGPDGSQKSPARQVTRDEIRALGMNMIEAMRDPSALVKAWNEKPTTVNTAEGAVSHAWNPRTRKWELVASNPKDPKSNTDKYNQQRAYDQLSRLIGERLGGKYDDITGKLIKPPEDPRLASELTALAHEQERKNPGQMSPGEIVGALFDQADRRRADEADAGKRAEQDVSAAANPLLPDFIDPAIKGSRKEMIESRKSEILKGRGVNKPATGDAAKPAKMVTIKYTDGSTKQFKDAYSAPNGKTVSINDIVSTAKRHNQTPEQVIENLRLQ